MVNMKDKIEKQDILKWLEKLEAVVNKIEVFDSKGEEMLKNIRAYMSDSRHFLEKGDFVLSFECMIHANAIFETCRELGVFNVSAKVE